MTIVVLHASPPLPRSQATFIVQKFENFASRSFLTNDCCKSRQLLEKKDQKLSESFIVLADHGDHNWGPCHRLLPTSFGKLAKGFCNHIFQIFFGGWMLRKLTTFLENDCAINVWNHTFSWHTTSPVWEYVMPARFGK